MKKWIKSGAETSVEQIFLRNIGAESMEEVNGWFQKSYAGKYEIKGLDEAVALANQERFKNGCVYIVGDYDADGVTATSILTIALKKAGFKHVQYRIPRRFTDGFGINETMIDEIKAETPDAENTLVLTCDNGIAQLDPLAKAKAYGFTVIVTDHHMPAKDDEGNDTLPEVDAVVDPNADAFPGQFTGYCGAGLAWRFARKLLAGSDKKLVVQLLTLAAVGTVCDVMPLREENYVIVKDGLRYMAQYGLCNTGLFALVSALGLRNHVSAHDLGFKVGPCINAASRMIDDGALLVVKQFAEPKAFEELVTSAEYLMELNEKRKEAKREGMDKANQAIASECLFGDAPLVLNVPGVGKGIIGLLASTLAENNRVPAFVFTDSENGLLQGSARGFGEYNVKEELDKVQDLLEHYGGHAGAAGLTIKAENLDLLRNELIENLALEGGLKIVEEDTILFDLEITAAQMAEAEAEAEKYEPYGEGNPAPVFKVTGFNTVPRYGAYKKLMGADGSTVKLWSAYGTAVGFGLADQIKEDSPKKLELIGTLSNSYFGSSKPELQLEFADVRVLDLQKVTTPLAARLAMMAAK